MVDRYADLVIYELNSEDASEKHYQYHKAHYPKEYPILVFYSKEKDFLDSNCVLLQCEMKIVRGIDKEDIDSHSVTFKAYLNTFYLLEWTLEHGK